MLNKSIVLAWVAFLSLGNISSVDAASFYKITDIGSLVNSSFSFAYDINNLGQVIFNSGLGTINGEPSRAFVYENGQVVEIKPLSGDTDVAVESINNLGQVVGNSVNGNNFTSNNPFIYASGKTQPLIGVNNGIPYGINDTGEVVGGAQGIGAFLYQNGRVFSFLSEGSPAYGVNNQSQVVGVLNGRRAYLYENGIVNNLGTLEGDDNSSAYGINDLGEVVGYSAPTGIDDGRAFIYSKDKGMVNLGRLSPTDTYSVALDINNKSQVVGSSGSSDLFSKTGTGIRAFIFDDNKLQDLNKLISPQSKYIVTQARAINDKEEIVGAAAYNGQLRAVLLTPISDTTSVSEPSFNLGIFAFGSLGMSLITLKLKRKRKKAILIKD